MLKFLDTFFTVGVSSTIISFLLRLLLQIIIILVGSQIIKLLCKFLNKTMTKAKAETGVVQFVVSFVKVSLYILLGFMVATKLGVDTATVVALLGSAGVAIGLAVQGSLANLAGGVLILLTKPFVVGDYIMENAGKLEGEVVEIAIFYTKLKTPDQHIVVLPNGNLANNSLVNFSSVKTRRLDIHLGISYKADLKKAKEVLLQVLENEPSCCKDMETLVVVNDLKDSSVELIVRCYTLNEEYWATRFHLTEACKSALDEAEIEIPFPQLSVHVN